MNFFSSVKLSKEKKKETTKNYMKKKKIKTALYIT